MFNKMKYFFYPERRFVTFAPIMSNNPKSPIIDLQQQQLLLRMEYEYEKEEFKRQTETMGVARKVKRGLCWYPVSLGRSYYNSLNQLVIDITRTENKEIEHSFEFGRPVCFFHQSFEGKVKYMDFIATISFADEERMVVVLPGAGALAELQTDGILGVQLYFDETSYRAMFEALEDTIRAKDNRLAELRDILLGTQKPGFRELYPVRFPWLNSTQETAVNKVLCTRDVSIVHGPPGTGKTLLAKAVAGEANVPFFSMSGSSFVEMYVGVGASRVRDLFKQASEMAPCIIFIDEIDAIGQSRDSVRGGDSEREQTLNQLLAEMDGFDTSKGIVILAATNRPETLDKALLRPGRFDRRVIVEKPDLQGRIDTLKVHSRNVKMDETVDLRELALATAGAVGADLANIINEAALTAVRSGRSMVSQADLIGAVELVFAGKEKKGKLLGDQEKKVVAYHEVGHALLVALQKHTEPVQRITIVPRTMGSLGYVWQVPEEEKYMETKAELEANIVTTLGGRAAEELKFESVTTGAANDIEQATKTVRAMITMYGMSDKFGLMQLETVQGKYLDRNAVLQCSDKTAAKVDEEIRNQLKKAYDEAKKLLSEHMNALDAIAQYLIEKESITGQEFMEIFNRVENAEQNVEQE